MVQRGWYLLLTAVIILALDCIVPTLATASLEVNGLNSIVVLVRKVRTHEDGAVDTTLHGTGFFVQDSLSPDSGQVYFVTAKHLVGSYDKFVLDFRHPGGFLTATLPLRDSTGRCLWLEHPDTSVDVVAIQVTGDFPHYNLRLRSAKKLHEVHLGEDACFIGFPIPECYNGTRPFPVYRTGIVAFVRHDFEYSHSSDVLFLDAVSVGGHSGGPVLAEPGPTENPSLIGVVQGHCSIGSSDLRLVKVVPVDRVLEIIRARR